MHQINTVSSIHLSKYVQNLQKKQKNIKLRPTVNRLLTIAILKIKYKLICSLSRFRPRCNSINQSQAAPRGVHSLLMC